MAPPNSAMRAKYRSCVIRRECRAAGAVIAKAITDWRFLVFQAKRLRNAVETKTEFSFDGNWSDVFSIVAGNAENNELLREFAACIAPYASIT